jgi:N6-L-threonylcarbamoyladenine synthase
MALILIVVSSNSSVIIPSFASSFVIIKIVLQEAVQGSGISVSDVDAIAVATGPGLASCLQVGLDYARAFATKINRPIVAVNHLEAHSLVVRMPYSTTTTTSTTSSPSSPSGVASTEQPLKQLDGATTGVEFPYLTLLISGGHTEIWYARGVGDNILLGTTLDDSVGECMDKTARAFGLTGDASAAPTPDLTQSANQQTQDVKGMGMSHGALTSGGRALEIFARDGMVSKEMFDVPMRLKAGLDFSFSGLKSHARRLAHPKNKQQKQSGREHRPYPHQLLPPQMERQAIATSFGSINIPGIPQSLSIPAMDPLPSVGQQQLKNIAASLHYAIAEHLARRVDAAMRWCYINHKPINALVVCGGVAANRVIGQRLMRVTRQWHKPCVIAPSSLCGDNGVNIAWAAIEYINHNQSVHGRELEKTYTDRQWRIDDQWRVGPSVDKTLVNTVLEVKYVP